MAGPLKEYLYFTALTLDNNYSTAHDVSINYSKFPVNENFPAPKGSRVVVEIAYDNTADNVVNCDPSVKIPQGLNPWAEEMAAAFISFL